MKNSPLLVLASLLAVWPASARVWTDDQGRQVDAEFVELDGATVRLRLKSGKISGFPLAKLSPADRQWIRDQQAAPEPPSPPAPEPAALPQVDWSPLKEAGDRAPSIPAPPEPPAQALIAVSDFIGGARLYLKPDGSDAFPHLKFTTVGPFSDDRAWVKTAQHQGYINREGHFVIGGDSEVPLPEGGDRFGPFSCGLARFQAGEFVGFLDTGGKVAIAPDRFRRAQDFSEDLAAVSVDSGGLKALADAGLGPWCFIDGSGKTVIEGPFSNPQPFRGGASWVCTQPPETLGPYVAINRQGGLVPGTLMTSGRPGWHRAGDSIGHGRTVLTADGRTVIDWDGKGYSITALPEEGPIAFAQVLNPPFLRLVPPAEPHRGSRTADPRHLRPGPSTRGSHPSRSGSTARRSGAASTPAGARSLLPVSPIPRSSGKAWRWSGWRPTRTRRKSAWCHQSPGRGDLGRKDPRLKGRHPAPQSPKRSWMTTSESGRRSPRGQAGLADLPTAIMKLRTWSSGRLISFATASGSKPTIGQES